MISDYNFYCKENFFNKKSSSFLEIKVLFKIFLTKFFTFSNLFSKKYVYIKIVPNSIFKKLTT